MAHSVNRRLLCKNRTEKRWLLLRKNALFEKKVEPLIRQLVVERTSKHKKIVLAELVKAIILSLFA